MTRAWDMGLIDVPKRFDIVHAQSLAAPPARRGGLVVTVHDLTWRELPETFTSRGRRWHEAALGRALRHARAFVVSSEPVARELISSGASENVVSVIPLGCDHLPAPDFSATSQLLGRLGVQGEYLLSVCTLEPRKNLPRLLEAYALVRDRLPDPWPLVVVGPSGWGPGIERGPGVVPAGHVEAATLAGLYRRARLLAYVPLAEGFGLPPVEAMREGTPVVASTVPSVQDAAMRVDPTCVEEIADALAIVASDEDVRRQLVAAGHARAAQLTWAKTAGRHLRLWESLS
jgi:glycosyltransferase involved in cell wall biosynthesis